MATLSHAARQTLLRNRCNRCRLLVPACFSVPARPGEGRRGEETVRRGHGTFEGLDYEGLTAKALAELFEHGLVMRGRRTKHLLFTKRGRAWIGRMQSAVARVWRLHVGVDALWRPVPMHLKAQPMVPDWVLHELAAEVLQGRLVTDDDIRGRSRELTFGGAAAL